jgi:hypothetical protein
MLAQLVAIGPESIGLYQIGSGIDVSSVNFRDQSGVCQVNGIERLIDRHPPAVEDGPKGPIHQDRASLYTIFELSTVHSDWYCSTINH